MPIILTNLGSLSILDDLRAGFLDGLGVALFRNNYIPLRTSNLANFTEASFPGYAPGTLSIILAAALNINNDGQIESRQVVFSSTGASLETMFGFLLYDIGPDVIFAERFPVPIPMFAAGSVLSLIVRITLASKFNG